MISVITVKCTECDYQRDMSPDEKPVKCPRCGGEVIAK